MNCPEVRARLPGLLYHDLNPDEVAAVEQHLIACRACRRERHELDQVRQALAAAPAPAVQVDLARLYRQAAEDQARRARRWRRAAFAFGGVAALLLVALALRLQVRMEGRRLVLVWGEQPPPSAEPAPPIRPEPRAKIIQTLPRRPRDVESRLRVLDQLVHALAADLEGRDDQQRQDLDLLRNQLEGFRRQADRRWDKAERSVDALYAAQFRLVKKGEEP